MSYGNTPSAPFGLQPRYTLGGANWNGQVNQYIIAYAPTVTTYATSIFNGDPVSMNTAGNTGTIIIATAGGAGAGLYSIGVFIGCRYTDANGNLQYSKYWPASTVIAANSTVTADVVDDPNIIMDVQSNANPGAAQNIMNQNANFATGAGSTLSGLSGYMLNIASHATTSTLDLRMMRFVPITGNIASAPFNNVLCAWNTHAYKSVGTLGAVT